MQAAATLTCLDFIITGLAELLLCVAAAAAEAQPLAPGGEVQSSNHQMSGRRASNVQALLPRLQASLSLWSHDIYELHAKSIQH
jgi:hypothetical protein